MSYQDSLRPWVVYRLLPNCQRLLMERFRRRNDAEAYLKAVQRLQPDDRFEIIYETAPHDNELQSDFCLENRPNGAGVITIYEE